MSFLSSSQAFLVHIHSHPIEWLQLLEHGADVHYNNPVRSIVYFGTALHEAVRIGSLSLVSLLLHHDANPFMGNL